MTQLDNETVDELIISAVTAVQNKFAPRRFNDSKILLKLQDFPNYEKRKKIENEIERFKWLYHPKIQDADRARFFKENRKNFPDLDIFACEYLAAAQTYVANEERLREIEDMNFDELNEYIKK